MVFNFTFTNRIMKKLIYILFLFPLIAQAQVNGTIQRTSATGVVRYFNSGAAGIDTLVNAGIGTNGFVPVYNSTLKKSVWTNPTGFGTNFWSRNVGTSTLSPAIPNDKLNMGTGSITGGVGSFTSSGSTGAATITQSSGSGVGLTITKGGNGEGLVVNKTSGSGAAAVVNETMLIGSLTPIANGGSGSLSPLEVAGTSGGTGIAIVDNNLMLNAQTYVLGQLLFGGGTRRAGILNFRKGADTTLASGYGGFSLAATKLISGNAFDRNGITFYADNGMSIFPDDASSIPGYKIHRIYGYTAANSFGVGTAGTDSIEVHDNVTKQTKLIPGNYYATAASIPTQYWQRSGTTLSPLTSGDNILTTGNITGGVGSFTSSGSTGAATITQSSGSGVGLTITKGGNGEGLIVNKTSGSGNAVTVTGGNTELVGLTASSASVTASNGVSGAFANNATSFETFRATNSGSGLIASFRNSGGEVASISNSGGAIFSNQITVSTTSLPSAIAASSTNSGGRVLTLLGESSLEPLAITQKGSGPLATFGTSDGTTYVGQSIIRNNGSIYTRGQLEVGNLLVGDATDSVMVHRAIDLTVRRVPTTGTGSAVFSASPTFTTGATIDAGTSNINFGSTSNYGYMTLNNDATLSGMLGIFGGASGDLTTMYVQVPSGGSHVLRVGSTDALQTNSVGDLTIAGSNATKASGTAWINPSDSRLKTNIRPYTKGLSEVLKIEPKVWNFNKASGQNMAKDNVSVIAQELQKVMPEMVVPYKGKLNGKDAELLSVDGSDYTMLLINAVKEQQAIIEKLKERITALESK
jgi:hypothetical protein